MSIIQDFFNSMNENVPYCHWKSIDRMKDVFEGISDIDILIDKNYRQVFHKILSDYNAINVKPRLWMTYPSMDDYLLYDSDLGVFYHLHVHYKLIMGKKNAKEYILPLEDIYISTRLKSEEYNTFFVKPEVDLLMLILRYAVKYSSVNMYYQKWRRFKVTEIKELGFLIPQCNKDELLKYAHEFDVKLNLMGKLFDFVIRNRYLNILNNISSLKKIEKKIDIYKRIGSIEVFFVQKMRKYLNLYAAKGRNNAKHPISGGITIAVVGCDGSGKTTVTNTIIKNLRIKLSARKYYMGFNARSFSWTTRILALLSYFPRSAKFIFKNSLGKKINIFGQLIIEYGGYLDRKSLYKQSLRDKANGMIGFYERFPLKNTIDYPQCFFNEEDLKIIKSSPFLTKLSNCLIEKYEIFQPADLNFFIRTVPDIIRERREMTDKTFEKVKMKFERVSDYVDGKEYFIEIDGSKPLNSVVLDIQNVIFRNL